MNTSEAAKILGIPINEPYSKYLAFKRVYEYDIECHLTIRGLVGKIINPSELPIIDIIKNSYKISSACPRYSLLFHPGDKITTCDLFPWQVLISGEDCRITISCNGNTYQSDINEYNGTNAIESVRCIIEAECQKEYEEKLLNLSQKVIFHVKIENTSPHVNPHREYLHEAFREIGIDPRAFMDDVLLQPRKPGAFRPVRYSRRFGIPYKYSSLKYVISRIHRREDRIKMINLLWRTNIPKSRNATEVVKLLWDMEEISFGLTESKKIRELVDCVRVCDYEGVKKVLVESGWLKK